MGRFVLVGLSTPSSGSARLTVAGRGVPMKYKATFYARPHYSSNISIDIRTNSSVLTYRLLSGSEAFRAPSEGELVHKILHTRMSFPDLAFTRVSDTGE